MARMLKPRKKIKKTYSRRLHTGWAACPTDTFWKFKDYARCELDKKEVGKTIKAYIRENFKGDEKKIMLEAPDWAFTSPFHIAASMEWTKLEFEFPRKWNAKTAYEKFFIELKRLGQKAIDSKVEETVDGAAPVKRTIADIVKERTSDFIGGVENVLDGFFDGTLTDIKSYSAYDELKKIDAPYNMAKGVYDYYKPILEEAEEIVTAKPTTQLGEAYSDWRPVTKRRYRDLLKSIVAEADRYMLSKKAVRKTRVAKPKAADKQVQHMKYLKDSAEFKLTSINPALIVGAQRLYTFNIKSRVLTEYLCASVKGFEVKGSTIQFMNEVDSRQVKLRNPDDVLPVVLKKLPNMVDKEWQKLTTKTSVPNARVNKDTLILRVLDK